MNWLDFNFWFFGPTSIWFLGCAVFVNAFILWLFLRVMNKFIPILPVLKDIIPELERIIVELRKDTVSLNLATSELDSELSKTRTSIDAWLKIIQRIYFWLPTSGNSK